MAIQRYNDGTEIHVGQRVIYNNQAGEIVLVADSNEYSPAFPKVNWSNIKSGFLIRFDNGALLSSESPDEFLFRDKNETA
jgi:hypothetical protein